MLRSSLFTAGALLICTSAFAQQDVTSRLKPITAPVREVTVKLDRATGVTTRTPTQIDTGTKDPVFNNTCASGYYLGLSSATASGGSQADAVVDQGRVPSTTSPLTALCEVGLADSYEITQFQIGYCTTTGAVVDLITNVWNNLGAACPNNFGAGADATITVLGMPRSAAAGTLACYLVTIDLGTPGFTLNGGAANNTAGRFGWSHQYPLTTGTDGPIIAGNPNIGGCAPCAGTIWERPAPTTNPGTGLGTTDSFWWEQFGTTFTGCYFFGGNPFAGFHLRIDAKVGPPPIPSFCDFADGAHALCPCGATNPTGGCNIAQGAGVQLDLASQTFAPNAATLTGTGYPVASTPAAVIIRGNNQEATPVPFYDGLRCVGLTGFARLAATTASSGVSTHTFGHAIAAGTYFYQAWFRNTPVSFCVTTGPGSGAGNLTNGRALTW
jgi:hypothetical protein